ncbi:hypothetical protein BMS17_06385 [Pseudomonas sp. C9]|nr:hypothetical protein BMS17_06385 [Pseudomonas sp. C9]
MIVILGGKAGWLGSMVTLRRGGRNAGGGIGFILGGNEVADTSHLSEHRPDLAPAGIAKLFLNT